MATGYATALDALDSLDRLSAQCVARLGLVRSARPNSDTLTARFLSALSRHRATREDARRRLRLPKIGDPGPAASEADADLPGLRQALDDLMVGYAESLPLLADASLVARLATDMVEVSKLRTVIDLWVEAEAA